MNTVAILPAKSFDKAKQRLSPAFQAGHRTRAGRGDVRRFARRDPPRGAIDRIIVVTADRIAARIATGNGADVIQDTSNNHSEAAELGIARAIEIGARRALVVPGDCPLLDPAELEALLAHPVAERSAVIVPDRHGEGTNALLLTPPNALTPAFGEGSRQRHYRSRGRAGVVAAGGRGPFTRPGHRHARGSRGAAGALPDHTWRRRAHARHAQPADAQPGGMIAAVPLEGLPEIAAGADLAEAIATSLAISTGLASAPGPYQLRAGDVLVIAHKVVSKAEGRVRSLADVVPSERATRLAQAGRQGSSPGSGRARRSP